jgi:uncharacterized protein YndB with AHSA1/START domain
MSQSAPRLIKPAPILRRVEVALAPAAAFELFVARIGDWWIKSHSLTTSGQRTVTIERHPGGRWYETGHEGEVRVWGHVIEIDPPRRILLAWQLDATWTFDPTLITEVEVLFNALDTGGTGVTLEHRRLEAFGEKAAETATSLGSDNGWAGLLAAYAALS